MWLKEKEDKKKRYIEKKYPQLSHQIVFIEFKSNQLKTINETKLLIV